MNHDIGPHDDADSDGVNDDDMTQQRLQRRGHFLSSTMARALAVSARGSVGHAQEVFLERAIRRGQLLSNAIFRALADMCFALQCLHGVL